MVPYGPALPAECDVAQVGIIRAVSKDWRCPAYPALSRANCAWAWRDGGIADSTARAWGYGAGPRQLGPT